MNWLDFLHTVKSALGRFSLPVGILLGALLSALAVVLKKQLEEHVSLLVSKAPLRISRVIKFRLWEKKYRKGIADEHKFLRLVGIRKQLELSPPSLKDVFVDLELEAPSSQARSQHLQPALSLRSTFQIHTIVEKFQHIVILGNPGAGKTTLLGHLVALCTRSKTKAEDGLSSLLPIYIPLRRCLLNGRPLVDEVTDPNTGIVSAELLKSYPKEFFESRLEGGKCLVLFDGLDEVLDQERHVAAARLVQRCGTLYPKSRVIVTSRIAGWRGLLGSDFSRFVIRELSSKEIERLVNQWYLAVLIDTAKNEVIELTDELRDRTRKQAQELASHMIAAIRSSEHLQEIGNSPLILSLMCLVYYVRQDLPQRRVELYSECARVLLREWDEMDKQLSHGLSLVYEEKTQLLQHIAMYLFQHSAAEVSRENLLSVVTEFVRDRVKSSPDAEDVVRHICERSGLVTEKAIGTYAFAHLTFQEYFAALGLVTSSNGVATLLEQLSAGGSQEVALLYAGAAKNANYLVASLFDRHRELGRLEYLLLAARAAAESTGITLDIKSNIVAQLHRHFDATEDSEILLQLQKALRGLGVDREIIRTFEDYEIIEELGRGGFATTYRAVTKSSRLPVAIKVFHSGSGQYVRAMAKEIELLKSIKHEALVEIFGVGSSKDQLFVTMEFVQGASLEKLNHDLMRSYLNDPGYSGGSDERSGTELVFSNGLPILGSSDYFIWAFDIAHDVFDGVETLHDRGIVHGDVKHSNVLVHRRDGQIHAKVSDFCIDALIGSTENVHTLTQTQFRLPYSPRFAAPERLRTVFDRENLMPQLDTYSLGVLCFDLFLLPNSKTYTHPMPSFERLKESETYRKVLESPLTHVLEKAIDRDPKARFATVHDLREAIQQTTPLWLSNRTPRAL
jgi:energy-coupling factor transporter ATP-binding protein EcfA2